MTLKEIADQYGFPFYFTAETKGKTHLQYEAIALHINSSINNVIVVTLRWYDIIPQHMNDTYEVFSYITPKYFEPLSDEYLFKEKFENLIK